MNCFVRLGLPRDADERAIKRAYARAIRITRPDDDAAGFQALNEAYQQALHIARVREADEDLYDDDVDEVHVDATPVEAEAQPPSAATEATHAATWSSAQQSEDEAEGHRPRHHGSDQAMPEAAVATEEPECGAASAGHDGEPFDFGEFYREMLFRGDRDRAQDFRAWLHSNDALYNFELKDHVGQHVQYWLVHDEEATPLRSGNLEALGEFFGIDIHDGLASMNTARWAVTHEDTAHYGEPRKAVIRQLKRPYGRLRALALAAVPGWSGRMAALGRKLARDYGELPPGIDPGQFELARLLAMPGYVGRSFWAMLLARSALAMLAFLAILLPVVAISAESKIAGVAFDWSLQLGVGVFVGGAVWRGVNLLRHLHTRSEGERLWHAAALPAGMALGGIVLSLLLHESLAGLLVSAIALLLTARHWARIWDAIRMTVGGLWSHSALTSLPFDVGTFGFGLGFGALALLACDIAYARRHDIPLLAAAAGNPWTLTTSYVLFAAGLALKQAMH